jgi:hypothetical protein
MKLSIVDTVLRYLKLRIVLNSFNSYQSSLRKLSLLFTKNRYHDRILMALGRGANCFAEEEKELG